MHIWQHSKFAENKWINEINESGAIAKISISVESDTVKLLKAFRIISSEVPVSLLILNW